MARIVLHGSVPDPPNAFSWEEFTRAIDALMTSYFHKADAGSVAFSRVGAAGVELKAGTLVYVDGHVVAFVEPRAVILPALAPSTTYSVFATGAGDLVASPEGTSPQGYPLSGVRKIGGFRTAADGSIRANSLWDLASWRDLADALDASAQAVASAAEASDTAQAVSLMKQAVYASATEVAADALAATTKASEVATNTATVNTRAAEVATNTATVNAKAAQVAADALVVAAKASEVATNTATVNTRAAEVGTNTTTVNAKAVQVAADAASAATSATTATNKATAASGYADTAAASAAISAGLNYVVSIYHSAGIKLGTYYAARSAATAGIHAYAAAEVVAGGAGSSVSFYIAVGGNAATGLLTAVYGAPLLLANLNVAVQQGQRVDIVVVGVAGSVTEFAAQLSKTGG
mgnify:CR=1 FL=1